MSKFSKNICMAFCVGSLFLFSECIAEEEAILAMRKATDFMMNTVSYKGGFVQKYSDDLSRQWGELPARRTQIWVDHATTGVGEMLLDAYRVTGDEAYLGYAKRVADALVYGQHPVGGWHYFIDFDMPSVQKWYDEVASKCNGFEEYYHYYGNCTFDDDVTAGAIRFLLNLYMETLDPKYRAPLMKGLGFVLEAQFSNGAWPQRYPLSSEFPHAGHKDYTSCYTFNDEVMSNNIWLLIDAYEKLGDERYLEAAKKGMDFYILSQMPRPQAGWANQYYYDMTPAHGRSYEPEAISTGETNMSITELMKFYKYTGDSRYLNPIEAALEWLDNSYINRDPEKEFIHVYYPGKKYTHAYYYEPVTNKPLWNHPDWSGERLRVFNNYSMEDIYPYALPVNMDVDILRGEYERVRKLSLEQCKEELDKRRSKSKIPGSVDSKRVEEILGSQDSRGAWTSELKITNYRKFILPPEEIKGIMLSDYVGNMYYLMGYVKDSTTR